MKEQVACYCLDLHHSSAAISSIQKHRKGRNSYYGFSNKQRRIHCLSPKKWRVNAGCLLGHFWNNLIPGSSSDSSYQKQTNKQTNKQTHAELTGQ